jgi:hypothetical protein
MKIDTEHLHYWMCAIRDSSDTKRTLDAFWGGQIRSKEWLIESLAPYVNYQSSVDIHGGWVGVLASLMFQSDIPITNIRSVDIDPWCESISNMMNRKEQIEERYRAVTSNMTDIRSDADIIINTSCEHITQDEYDLWLSGLPYNSTLVLQSNNYIIPEHVRPVNSLIEFESQCQIKVLWSGELVLPLYTRYMIIGKQCSVSIN